MVLQQPKLKSGDLVNMVFSNASGVTKDDGCPKAWARLEGAARQEETQEAEEARPKVQSRGVR